MITTWYEIADSKPEFRIDRDKRTLVSLKQQVTVGWSDSEDEITSDFTALPSTTVQMAPLYSQEFLGTAYNSGVKENDEPVEENKSQNPKSKSLVPCRPGRLKQWINECKSKNKAKSLVPQRREPDIKSEYQSGVESTLTPLSAVGPLSSLLSPLQLEDKPSSIVSIDTPSFASIAASAGKQEIKRGAGTTGRGAGTTGRGGGTSRGGTTTGRGGARNKAVLKPLTAASAQINERIKVNALEQKRKATSQTPRYSATVESYLNE